MTTESGGLAAPLLPLVVFVFFLLLVYLHTLCSTMDVLDIADPESGSWLDRQLAKGKLHLLLGDSVARDCGMESRITSHKFLNLGRGWATWSSIAQDFPRLQEQWQHVATAEWRRLGTEVLWLMAMTFTVDTPSSRAPAGASWLTSPTRQ